MRVTIIAVGRLKAGPEKELAARYLDRFAKTGPASGLEFVRTIELAESRASNPETRKREEAAQIEKSLPDNALVVALDERGKALDSPAFASLLGDARDMGQRDLVFVIGGADGIDADFRQKAQQAINLGRMTWPHQLVRILIAEQLYRAVTILSGHPYHRV
ncbi:23S rRNA (pseudouridine(1915)-N(3))-methyltransferase RlmH [Rhizobium sp. RU36D]|uniref:23S rRNA (pseudouridine(1915)-N(3))-methyltransferase RlmH n=1 Tax=Rhizobium sp. RU36D TaxID=1907415 RepID=UPI0009D85C0D|nr:23S rRNA (pseudouridine(1915)-N(3))-methyltransferase RlmH [Rhizobium sp. RU36D]SMC88488.1 23S rRNA (pseudouridine1915-N3)-methyltransferase [Rhizobium sp. RU36D]